MLHNTSVLPLHQLGTVVSLDLFFSTATELFQFHQAISDHLVSNLKPHSAKYSFPGYVRSAYFLLHEILERLLVYPDFDFSFYSHLQFQRKFPLGLVKDLV